MRYELNPDCSDVFTKEQSFELFKSSGLLCCVKRIEMYGNLNGYVAVQSNNSLFKKEYSDKILVENIKEVEFNGNYIGLLCQDVEEFESGILSIDMAIQVHGGLTYSRDYLIGIDQSVFEDLWWFGFDTVHYGDAKPILNEIDLQFPSWRGEEYRTFDYVKQQTINLANQLSQWSK